MANDVTVLIADPPRLAAFRDELHLAGRVLRFSSSNLAAVFETIRANQPRLVAVDAMFADTAAGKAFIHRIEGLAIPSSDIQLVTRENSAWTTKSLSPLSPLSVVSQPAAAPRIDVKSTGLNTRRAPRFLVLDPLKAKFDKTQASLIDLSMLGAQVLSEPVLKPNQKIKIELPGTGETVHVSANIKWSLFEKPTYASEPYYRAGVEFTDANDALEEYCRRHCAEDPLPIRSR